MTEAGNTGLIWEHRLALWLPRPLLFGAFLIAACLGTAYVSFQWFFGLGIENGAISIGLFVVFALMLPVYLFGPFDRQQYKTEIRTFYIPRNTIRISRFTGAAGVLASVALWELIVVAQGDDLLYAWTRFDDGSVTTVLFLMLGWLGGRTYYIASTGVWDRPVPQKSDVDLLNLEAIYASGRVGLSGSLVFFIVIAIAGFLVFDEVGSGLWVIGPMFVGNFGIGLVILLVPARKVRSLIRDVKQEELARLEPLLRQARDNTLSADTATQGRLNDLLAYKTQVESTREWPFDSSTLLRFGLYLLIPVASMVGGALMERVVDMVLD